MCAAVNPSNLLCEREARIMAPSGKLPYFPLVVASARGAEVTDIEGRTYIDLLSSAAAVNTGHCHPTVVQAIRDQTERFIHYTPLYLYHESVAVLAEEIARVCPISGPKRVSFGLSGSDCMDGALKLARAYTGRRRIISFIGSYHGSTFGALSVSAISLKMQHKIGPLLPDIHHFHYPDCRRCRYGQTEESCSLNCLGEITEAFEIFLPPDEVAAVVLEPIAGDGGFIVPPARYVTRLSELCRQHGILLIVDEIQQGFGRTGRWFSIEHFQVEPDLVVMGKAMASGLPMGATVTREPIALSLEAPGHAFTLMGNPVCCQAALATLKVIEEEDLIRQSEEKGARFMAALRELKQKHPVIGDVRGLGFTIGVELVDPRNPMSKSREAASKICWRAWEKGLILTSLSTSVLRIQPPLVITDTQLDQSLQIIDESIQDYMDDRIPDSVLDAVRGW